MDSPEKISSVISSAVGEASKVVDTVDIEEIASSVGITNVPTKDDLKKALSEIPVEDIVNRVVSSPSAMNPDTISAAVSALSPDTMKDAGHIARSEVGRLILTEMKKRGVDTREIHRQAMRDMAANKGLAPRGSDTGVVVLLVYATRKVKEIFVERQKIETYAGRTIGATVVGASCRRLAKGPWDGLSICIWYDPKSPLKVNKIITKMAGFSVVGNVIVSCEQSDLMESSMREVAQIYGVRIQK